MPKHLKIAKSSSIQVFRPWLYLCLIVLAAFSPLVSAEIQVSNTLNNQRYNYELAKVAIKNEDIPTFKSIYLKLNEYPLKPYLDYQYISSNLSQDTGESKVETEAFIRLHSNTYLGDKLHREYLYHLASNKRWQDLIYWYRPKYSSVAIQCRWIEARVHGGNASALSEVAPIWTKAKSLPKSCDELFAMWMDSEFYTEEIAWKRFMLAMNASNTSLGRYLSRLLSERYQHYVDLAFELKRNPNIIGEYHRFSRYTPEMQNIILYGVKKLSKVEPEMALRYWRRYEAKHIFDMEHIRTIKSRLAANLINEGKNEIVEQMLTLSPSLRHPSTLERLIRSQLKEQRWEAVLSTIHLLPEQQLASKRWQYWKTRAREQLGKPAFESYQNLAQSRSYYGFLAADKLGKQYKLNAKPVSYTQSAYDRVRKLPDFIRAKELWLTGHFSEAYAEWYYGMRTLSSKETIAAGALASQWSWHDRAINAMIAGRHWGHLDLRFPLAYEAEFTQAAKDTKLHPELLFAVARQESAMTKGAVSSAGARGLMQLMPNTARQTARKFGLPHSTEDLFNANHNITLGSRYLNEMFEQFNGNRILATAAYNAGPHRVKKWISDAELQLPFDIWIETIPFKETRGYVQNVLTYSVIYSFRMGTPTHLITQNEAKTKL